MSVRRFAIFIAKADKVAYHQSAYEGYYAESFLHNIRKTSVIKKYFRITLKIR